MSFRTTRSHALGHHLARLFSRRMTDGTGRSFTAGLSSLDAQEASSSSCSPCRRAAGDGTGVGSDCAALDLPAGDDDDDDG